MQNRQQSYGEATLRAALLYTTMAALLVIWFFYCLAIMLLAPWIKYPKRFELIYAHYCRIAMFATKHICGVDFVVDGLDNLQKAPQGRVIMANHQSTWETLALQTLFIPNAVILKRELLFVPFFGWCLAMLRPIFIDRSSRKEAMTQIIERGGAHLRAGYDVLIFPQGTRVAPQDQQPFKLGGSILATETGAEVIPVAHNAGIFWPNKSFIKTPGTIQVVIGEPISTKGKSAEQVNQEVEQWILNKVEEISETDIAFNGTVM